MKISKKGLGWFLAGNVLFSSCVSSTLIQSNPAGAKLYIDGEPAGVTPYRYSDMKIIGSVTSVWLQMEGYEPLRTSFTRTEEADIGAIVGGAFVWVPFLWAMRYKPTHIYELSPSAPVLEPAQPVMQQETKAERLRELKKLLDEKILTQAEYENEKKKILAEQ